MQTATESCLFRTRDAPRSTIVPNHERIGGVTIEQDTSAGYEYATWSVFPHNYPQVWMNDTDVTRIDRIWELAPTSCALTCRVA